MTSLSQITSTVPLAVCDTSKWCTSFCCIITMAPKMEKESLLELCTRVTELGNSISVRMLEYLSTTRNYPHGFRELATDFLEICRNLWPIEAGLTEAIRLGSSFSIPLHASTRESRRNARRNSKSTQDHIFSPTFEFEDMILQLEDDKQ